VSIRSHEKFLRDRLAKLQELDLALNNRILAEREHLYMKQLELQSIDSRLRALGWPGTMIIAYPGTYFLGRYGAEYRDEVNRLVRRREELIKDIERERRMITELSEQRSRVTAEIQDIVARLAKIEKIITEQKEREELERRKKEEVIWLLHELQEARKVNDLARIEAIIRRLRELGYTI